MAVQAQGMHWRTYDRLCREYELAEQAMIDGLCLEYVVRPTFPKAAAWSKRHRRAITKVSGRRDESGRSFPRPRPGSNGADAPARRFTVRRDGCYPRRHLDVNVRLVRQEDHRVVRRHLANVP
jgi:hypothetical protein